MAFWNPATWSIVDTLQGQNNNTGQTFSSAMSNGYGGTSPSYSSAPQANSSSKPQSQGGNTSLPGSMYYDADRGVGQVSDGNQWNDVLGTSTSRATGGGGGGASTPSYDPNELRQFDDQKSLYERLLQSAGATLDSGLNSLNDSYNLNRNRANEDRSRALQGYADQRNQTEVGKEKALNTVGDNSRVMRNSLMRILGLASGGGSAFDLADTAVARDATKNRAGVVDSYSQNIKGLDSAESDAKTQFQRLLEDLDNQKRTREEALRAGVTGQQQSIQGQLAQLMADRARLTGGDQFAAADPYRQQFLQAQSTLDQLPQQFRTAVDYNPATLQQPTLKDYMVNRASINGSAPGQQQQYSPYANFLQKNREEEKQRLV